MAKLVGVNDCWGNIWGVKKLVVCDNVLCNNAVSYDFIEVQKYLSKLRNSNFPHLIHLVQ